MPLLTENPMSCRTSHAPVWPWSRGWYVKSLRLFVLAGTMMLAACGGGSSSGAGQQVPLTLSGNWQFTMAPPADGSFLGGLQGGFLLQNGSSVTGAATYAVSLPQLLIPCNTGSATITGTTNSQNVWTLTVVAGTQTFSLQGVQSLDGLTMAGTYTSTAGTSGDGGACGTLQTVPMQWSAIFVPPLTGPIQGSFHSAGGAAGLAEQDFPVSGYITQAANTGGSSATVTGNLSFVNPLTGGSDYPCFTVASVSGQISGNFVTLEMIAADGSDLGLIGEPVGSLGRTGVNPVTFDSVQGGYVLQGAGPAYLVATTSCPGGLGNVAAAGDFGNMCLALNGVNACQSPITLTPSGLTFPAQPLNSPPAKQTITLTDTSGGALNGVTLSLTNNSDKNNFTEEDNCVPGGETLPSSSGQTISPLFSLGGLLAPQFCTITIFFTPLETCAFGAAQCPSPLTATLSVNVNNMIFAVPITGTTVSSDAVSTSQLDFGAGRDSEAGLPQLVWFASRSRHPAQTLFGSSNRTFQNVEHHAEID